MLYLVTGDTGSGKTTWLKGFMEDAARQGVELSGFYAPAVFEGEAKTGIATILLPGGESMLLATAAPDDGSACGSHAATGASCKAPAPGAAGGLAGKPAPSGTLASGLGLHWLFSEEAVARVNNHMRPFTHENPAPGVLIVDEVGFLEFDEGNGFTEAMRVLDEQDYAVAIVTMRSLLLERARERWSTGGNEVRVLTPQSAHPAFI